MKKKIILSLVTVVSFGFLFSYNIVKSGDSLQADNVEALAASGKYRWWNPSVGDCDTGGVNVCLDGGAHDDDTSDEL